MTNNVQECSSSPSPLCLYWTPSTVIVLFIFYYIAAQGLRIETFCYAGLAGPFTLHHMMKPIGSFILDFSAFVIWKIRLLFFLNDLVLAILLY